MRVSKYASDNRAECREYSSGGHPGPAVVTGIKRGACDASPGWQAGLVPMQMRWRRREARRMVATGRDARHQYIGT